MSKFSLDVLQKCVFPYVNTTDPDVLVGAVFGEDVALTSVGGDILASHVDPIVGAINNIGSLAVHVACNDLAASGIPPRWLLLLILVPLLEDEYLLEQIIRDSSRAAEEVGASIIGGHSGYSSGLLRPLVAVTALGTASGQKPVLTGGAHVGDSVLITKGIGLEGTGILALDFADIAIKLGLSEQKLQEARNLLTKISVLPEALVLAENRVSAMHDVTRGGVLETLLEIAYLSGVGVEIDSARIPIPPVVERFANAFHFDPMKMISSGTLVATVPEEKVEEVKRSLKRLKMNFAFVGKVTEGKGVHVLNYNGEDNHCTEIKCEEDELARIWILYPRGGKDKNIESENKLS